MDYMNPTAGMMTPQPAISPMIAAPVTPVPVQQPSIWTPSTVSAVATGGAQILTSGLAVLGQSMANKSAQAQAGSAENIARLQLQAQQGSASAQMQIAAIGAQMQAQTAAESKKKWIVVGAIVGGVALLSVLAFVLTRKRGGSASAAPQA
jgi:hypothetical protein